MVVGVAVGAVICAGSIVVEVVVESVGVGVGEGDCDW